MIQNEFLALPGKRIKGIRVDKNIEQCELAKLCAFEKASLLRIGAGHTVPTFLNLEKSA